MDITTTSDSDDFSYLVRDLNTIIDNNSLPFEALRKCLGRICGFLKWPVGHVYILDPDEQVLKSSKVWFAANAKNYYPFIKESFDTNIEVDDGLVGRAIYQQSSLWIDDLHSFENYKRWETARNTLKSGIAIPVIQDDGPQGVIEFYDNQRRPNKPEILNNLTIITNQMGTLLPQNRL